MSTSDNVDLTRTATSEMRLLDVSENDGTDGATQNSVTSSRKRKLTSVVWNDFVKIKDKNGNDVAKCNWCKKEFCGESSKRTIHLKKHLNTCIFRKRKGGELVQQSISVMSNFVGKQVQHFKFDQEESRNLLAKMIIKHNYSFNMVGHEIFGQFCASLNPNFKLVSRNTIRTDILNLHKEEKVKLDAYFVGLHSKITFTTDIWISDHSNIAYACLTAHFISDTWELKKKVIAFKKIPYPHDGETLFGFISELLLEWNLDKKICSMVVDNASANDVMVRKLKIWLCERKLLNLSGALFHVRCSAHILNLIVQDGLFVVKDMLHKIRETVSLLNRSPALMQKFEKALIHLKLNNLKKVGKDVPNRWNSTYLMLDAAIPLKEAYHRLSILEKSYKHNPSEDEWIMAQVVRDCLKLFYDSSNIFSGSKFPTSNLFFRDICKIQLKLREWENSEHECLRLMARPMKEKFDKYWEDCSLPLALATVVDPRCKMDVVEFYYGRVYGFDKVHFVDRVRTSFSDLYNEYGGEDLYANTRSLLSTASSNVSTDYADKDVDDELELEFDEWYKQSRFLAIQQSHKSELEKYLEEAVVPRKEKFHILHWWETNGAKYPTIAKIARDILAIPATTVASESAFSIGGRVIDDRRSCLAPEIVEALLTTSDWIETTNEDDVGTSAEDGGCQE